MTQTLDMDAIIEFLYPHKTLPQDILARTDTHQYLNYVRAHYAACLYCVYQLECPPCPHDPRLEETDA